MQLPLGSRCAAAADAGDPDERCPTDRTKTRRVRARTFTCRIRVAFRCRYGNAPLQKVGRKDPRKISMMTSWSEESCTSPATQTACSTCALKRSCCQYMDRVEQSGLEASDVVCTLVGEIGTGTYTPAVMVSNEMMKQKKDVHTHA